MRGATSYIVGLVLVTGTVDGRPAFARPKSDLPAFRMQVVW